MPAILAAWPGGHMHILITKPVTQLTMLYNGMSSTTLFVSDLDEECQSLQIGKHRVSSGLKNVLVAR